MHPYHFVALIGISPEAGWPVLAGRDNKTMTRESYRNGQLWFRSLRFLYKPANNIKQTLDRKEVFDEKTHDSAWSSSWSGSCRVGNSQMEKIVKQSMRIK